jgi:hypothetical protein
MSPHGPSHDMEIQIEDKKVNWMELDRTGSILHTIIATPKKVNWMELDRTEAVGSEMSNGEMSEVGKAIEIVIVLTGRSFHNLPESHQHSSEHIDIFSHSE